MIAPPSLIARIASTKGAESLPFVQALLLEPHQRRQQVADDAAGSGFDLHRDGHTRRQVDHPIVNLHFRAIKGHARRIVQLLTPRFARFGLDALRLLIRFVVPLVANNSIRGDVTSRLCHAGARTA